MRIDTEYEYLTLDHSSTQPTLPHHGERRFVSSLVTGDGKLPVLVVGEQSEMVVDPRICGEIEEAVTREDRLPFRLLMDRLESRGRIITGRCSLQCGRNGILWTGMGETIANALAYLLRERILFVDSYRGGKVLRVVPF